MNWRRLLSGLLATPIIVLILVALLIGTIPGAQLVAAIADTLVPGLSIGRINGRINRNLHLSDVRFDAIDGLSVQVDSLSLDWRPRCLFNRTLCSDRLNANGVQVDIDIDALGGGEESTEEPTPDTTESGFSLPFTIVAQLIELNRVRVRVDDMHFAVGQLSGSARFTPEVLRVNRLNATQIAVYIPSANDAGETPTAGSDAIGEKAAAEAPMPEDARSEEHWAMAHLPRVSLPFPITAHSVNLSRALVTVADMEHRIETVEFNAQWAGTLLQVHQLSGQHNWADIELKGSLDFVGHWPIDVEASGTLRQLPWTPGLDGQKLDAKVSGSLGELTLGATLDGQQQGQLSGSLMLKSPQLDYQVELSAERLSWPFGPAPQYQLNQLTLSSRGSLQQQRLSADGHGQALSYPEFRFTTELEHQPGTLTLEQAALTSEHGNASASGTLGYQDRLSWQAQLSSQQLDLMQLLPQVPLIINGHLATEGHWQGQDWKVAVANADLSGSYQQQPLTVRGDASLDNLWRVNANDLNLTLNDTELTLNSNSEQQWNLNGQLTLADASRWLPQAQGSAMAQIQVRGDHADPHVQLQLQATDLAYEQYQLGNAELGGDYYPLRNHQYELQLNAAELTLAQYGFSALTAHSEGDKTRQSLSADIDGDSVTPWGGSLALSGTLDPDFTWWQGTLSDARLTTPVGPWQQQQSAPLTFSFASQAFVVSEHCWQGPAASLCLPIPANVGTSGAAELTLKATLPTAIAPLLPDEMTLNADIDADIHTTWLPGQLPQVSAYLRSDKGEMVVQSDSRRAPVHLPWQRLNLDGSLSQQGLNLKLALDSDRPLIRSDITLDPEAPYPMRGFARLNNFDLTPLAKALPKVAELHGILSADVGLEGDLDTPLLNGRIQLEQGLLTSAVNPTELHDIDVTLTLDGQRANLSSELYVGDGPAQAQGWLDWSREQLELDINLDGDRLDVLKPPLLIAEASPSLRLTKTQQATSVTGRIDIPKASLTLAQLPEGGVAVSEDVEFVDQRADAESEPPAPFAMDLQLNIGDEVTVSGMGVNGRLGGQLTLRQKASQTPQLFGDINLQDGRFSAFGQRLTIRRGKVIFNGPPTLPTLDVEAVREIKSENVVAGIRLGGAVNAPQMTLFSNPTMEQQEILSYITQGRGLSSTDGGNALWASAAVNLGLAQTGGMLTSIGEELGFSNVNVGTEGDGDEAQVAISGYIGEKIFLKYGVNIFEPITEVTIRYYLQNRLWIEGINNTLKDSLDIYYSFDIE
ncbi:autotransporter secretion inner membrane protein TamB [Ferrimonas sediminum]|uniref:Autotransporter secretion inner membrane protein TamB n=1 Tax=Ferrimonas sediminum TaxID=718193 RepID=A0A1G9AKY2_9GAMM|nr:translocation/assembly module TamB domain-containing protein [Ferrimonas sediminum]SDK27901.1 autotransporter secretion inner membrane protein TamB [Ferrimonas sediminum]